MTWEDILKRTYGRLDETGYSPYNEERSLRTESPPEEESGDDTRDIVDDPEEWIRQQEEIPSERNTSEREEQALYNYAASAADVPLGIIERIESLARKVVSGNYEKRLKERGKTMKDFVDKEVSAINRQLRQLDTLESNELGFKWYDEMYRTEYIPNRKKLREALKRIDSIKDIAR